MTERKQKVRYNYTFLQELCKEHNLVLLKDYGNEKLHRDYKIEGNCKTERCSNIFVKTIGVLLKNKNFGCISCSKQIANERKETNNINKYGVKSPLQLESVKSQIKETNLERYGCEYATQSQEVRDKTVSTCIEKYGTECPLQNSVVKIKSIETNKEKYGVCYANQNNIIKEKIRKR